MSAPVIRLVRKLMAPLERRVSMMVARGVISLLDDGKKMQLAQVQLLADEVAPSLERFQEYGFSSAPAEGAEAVVVFPGGVRSHGIIIAVDDRRFRLGGMKGGEVALYDDAGQVVHLKRDGILIKSPLKVTAEAPEITLKGGSNGDQVAHLTDAGVSLESPLQVAVKAPTLSLIAGGGDQLATMSADGLAFASPIAVEIQAPQANVIADHVLVTSNDINLGGMGGERVARVGDTVSGGVISSGSAKVRAT